MLKNVASIQVQKVATFNSDRKNNQYKLKQIIQILQTMVIDYFSTHSYIVNISNIFFDNISLALDFLTFQENKKMLSSLSKILETGINVFKSNSQLMKKYKI